MPIFEAERGKTRRNKDTIESSWFTALQDADRPHLKSPNCPKMRLRQLRGSPQLLGGVWDVLRVSRSRQHARLSNYSLIRSCSFCELQDRLQAKPASCFFRLSLGERSSELSRSRPLDVRVHLFGTNRPGLPLQSNQCASHRFQDCACEDVALILMFSRSKLAADDGILRCSDFGCLNTARSFARPRS